MKKILLCILIILSCFGIYEIAKKYNKDNITSNINADTLKEITKDDALKLLEEKYGTEDKETGNLLSFGYIATVIDQNNNKYYAFRQTWLVDNDHQSFLQNVFVSLDGKTIKTEETPNFYEENQKIEL